MARLQALAGRPIPCVTADIRDVDALRSTFHDHPIAAVVHCAGLKSVWESEARPLAYYDVNVGGALRLIEVMGEAGVATMVFSSSATVYGQPEMLPVTESAPVNPQSVYGRTKRIVEDFLGDLVKANPNWRVANLRYFNPAGAHSSGMLGESPRGRPNNLVPLLGRVAVGEIAELRIYGDDWPTPDGTGVRDYIHVQDLAEGHVAALRHMMKAPGGITVNLGAGRGYSVREVVAEFARACGRPISSTLAARRRGEIASCYADVARADELLKWRPTRDLAAICADAWRWQKNGGRY
jgi:UDP-glucose 4-epimerase